MGGGGGRDCCGSGVGGVDPTTNNNARIGGLRAWVACSFRYEE